MYRIRVSFSRLRFARAASQTGVALHQPCTDWYGTSYFSRMGRMVPSTVDFSLHTLMCFGWATHLLRL
jgi:hypothetical protein